MALDDCRFSPEHRHESLTVSEPFMQLHVVTHMLYKQRCIESIWIHGPSSLREQIVTTGLMMHTATRADICYQALFSSLLLFKLAEPV